LGKTITLPGLEKSLASSKPMSGKESLHGKPAAGKTALSPSSATAGTASHRPGINSAKNWAHFMINFIAASSLSDLC
jgi:hypothetical protein